MLLKPTNRYGEQLNSYDAVKLLALLSMVIDHLGSYFFVETESLRALGRYAFPAFLFLVGYSGNWKIKTDIIVLSILLVIVAATTHHKIFPVNILVSIIITRLTMRWTISSKSLEGTEKLFTVFFIIVLFYPISTMVLDYGSLCLLFAISGYMLRFKAGNSANWFFAASLMFYAFIQWTFTDYHVVAKVFTLIVLAALYVQLRQFHLYTIQSPFLQGRLKVALQWLSSNALFFYFFHVSLFMLLELALYPNRLKHFQWF